MPHHPRAKERGQEDRKGRTSFAKPCAANSYIGSKSHHKGGHEGETHDECCVLV
jgi:hypothetical protein